MTAQLLPWPLAKFFQPNTNLPLAGGKVYTYAAGTSTPLATYSDSAGLIPNTNPVILDANGQANIYLTSGAAYKINILDASNVQIPDYPIDNIITNDAAALVSVLRADLANTSDVTKGDALIGVKQPFTGATARTQHQKNADRVCANDFGLTLDGVTNDAPAFQAAIDYCKSFSATGNLPTLYVNGNGSAKTILLNSSLNFTQIRSFGFTVDFGGCTIHGATTGQPVIDALDSQFVTFRNLIMFGVSGASAPNYGIQQGRAITNNDCANCEHENLFILGTYTKSALLNAGCEVFISSKSLYWNSSAAATAACLIQDAKNATHVSSQFFTATIAQDVQQSFNDNLFLNCSFEQIGGAGPAGGPAIKVIGNTNALRFNTCYAQNANTRVLDISGEHSMLEFDVHCEPSNILNNIRMLTNLGDVKFNSSKFKEYFLFSTNAMFTTTGAGGIADFINCELDVPNSFAAVPLFNPNGTTIDFDGTLKLGVNSSIYDLSALNSIGGVIECRDLISNLVLPANRSVTTYSHDSLLTRYDGRHYFNGGISLSTGTAIASAATISIPPYGFSFGVTGVTNITKINVNAGDEGRLIRLTFAGILTLTNGFASGKMVLAGNYVTAANYTILLYCDGTSWAEVSRSNNVVV